MGNANDNTTLLGIKRDDQMSDQQKTEAAQQVAQNSQYQKQLGGNSTEFLGNVLDFQENVGQERNQLKPKHEEPATGSTPKSGNQSTTDTQKSDSQNP